MPQIIQLQCEDMTLGHIQGMFKLKQSEIQQILEQEQAKLTRLQERMRLIEREGCADTDQEIRITEEEAQSFLFLKASGRDEDIPDIIRMLEQSLLRELPQLPQSPKVLLWRELDGKQEEFEFEAGYYVTRDLPAVLSDGFQIRHLPPEPMMATMTFHSSSAFASTACTDLAKWIERNGYSMKENELTITLLYVGGYSTLFTYITPFLQASSDLTITQISGILFLAGMCSFAGSKIGGHLADAKGPKFTITLGLLLQGVALLLFALPGGQVYLLILVLLIFMLGTWSISPAQQLLLVTLVPRNPDIALSVNTSFIQFGFALGSGLGGFAIRHTSILHLNWIGLAVVGLAGMLAFMLFKRKTQARDCSLVE